MQVSFTAFQREEIAHRLQTIAYEPELQADYGLTESEAEGLMLLFSTGTGVLTVTLTVEQVAVVVGELENLIEVARGNIGYENDPQVRGELSSFMGLLAKFN